MISSRKSTRDYDNQAVLLPSVSRGVRDIRSQEQGDKYRDTGPPLIKHPIAKRLRKERVEELRRRLDEDEDVENGLTRPGECFLWDLWKAVAGTP